MGELLHELAAEIANNPLAFVVELVQFAIFAFLVKAIAFGIGKRKGFLSNMLAERRQRIGSDLAKADESEQVLAQARESAVQTVAGAEAEAKKLLAESRREARQERAGAASAAEAEAERVVGQAREDVERERSEALGGIREQLVDLVAQATRRIMDEGLSPAEQRNLIQKAVLSSIDELESVNLS